MVNKFTESPGGKEITDKINEIVDALISGGGSIVVDQTFDGTSQNAQSGVAIEGAGFELASNKQTSITSSSTDTDYPSSKSVIELLKVIYPVGCIYLTINSTCPLSALFGTWTRVSAGRALWTGDGTNGNTTIAAGLPEISGSTNAFMLRYGSSTSWNGAFYTSGSLADAFNTGGSDFKRHPLYFKASESNSIYGKSTTVQPPAYVINAFRRTA